MVLEIAQKSGLSYIIMTSLFGLPVYSADTQSSRFSFKQINFNIRELQYRSFDSTIELSLYTSSLDFIV